MKRIDNAIVDSNEPVHNWFGLSYCSYLVLPRSVLQSMPVEWQKRFIQCVMEIPETIEWDEAIDEVYNITLHKEEEVWNEGTFERVLGIEIPDPYLDYQRGRRRIPLRK